MALFTYERRRSGVDGMARILSPYLLSAFCVVLGGFLIVREARAVHRLGDVPHVFATQLAYQACLLAVGAWLLRTMKRKEEGLLLLGLLVPFAMDLLGLTHVYGWDESQGRLAALLGAAMGAIVFLGAGLSLGWSQHWRLAVTALACACSFRMAGFVMITGLERGAADALSPQLVAAWWMHAATLLPVVLLSQRASDDDSRALERIGVAALVGFAAWHAWELAVGFGVSMSPVYLAPSLILLPAAVERLVPSARERRWMRILLDAGSLVALLLAAFEFTPSLIAERWANRIPLTPFYLALILATGVHALRASRLGSRGHALIAGLLGSCVILGGDLAEILSRARFPATWQALAILVLAAVVIARQRWLMGGVVIHAFASFVVASALETEGAHWVATFATLLCLGVLLIAAWCRHELGATQRRILAAGSTLPPVVVLAWEHDSLPYLLTAFTALAALALLGAFQGRRELMVAAGTSFVLAVGIVAWQFQSRGDVSLGRLFIEAGFLLLLVGVVDSLRRARRARLLETGVT